MKTIIVCFSRFASENRRRCCTFYASGYYKNFPRSERCFESIYRLFETSGAGYEMKSSVMHMCSYLRSNSSLRGMVQGVP
jgi:hypothetical protein